MQIGGEEAGRQAFILHISRVAFDNTRTSRVKLGLVCVNRNLNSTPMLLGVFRMVFSESSLQHQEQIPSRSGLLADNGQAGSHARIADVTR
jgi:hypothetical protein